MITQIRKAVKEHGNRAKVMEMFGLNEKELDEAIYRWTGGPTLIVKKAAQEVVKARVRSQLAKMLAVERELALQQLGLGKKVTLYRGVHGSYAFEIKKQLKETGEAKVVLYGAHSWTDNVHVARRFGTIVLKVEMPTRYVLSCHKTNARLARYHEYEYIVSIPGNTLTITEKDVLSGNYL